MVAILLRAIYHSGMLKVLITGGNGFVGRHLQNYLRDTVGEKGQYTISIFDLSLGDDVRNFESIRTRIDQFQPDYIFHLAAQAYVPESTMNPRRGFETNLIGTLNILESVRQTGMHSRILVSGTSEEYGYDRDDSELTEESAKKLAAFRNEAIGFIFQFHQLLPEFTAIENIAIPALIKGDSMATATENGLLLLEKIGLRDRANHKPNELSGGEQQRVSVCRALINRPKIIFADEPSGNLDSQNSKELHELFFRLREEFNQTFVIVTHNEHLADMADRKLVMQDGRFL